MWQTASLPVDSELTPLSRTERTRDLSPLLVPSDKLAFVASLRLIAFLLHFLRFLVELSSQDNGVLGDAIKCARGEECAGLCVAVFGGTG